MYRATSKLDRLAKESPYFTSQARRDDGRDGKSKQCCDFLYEREVMILSGSIKLSLPALVALLFQLSLDILKNIFYRTLVNL